MPIRTIMTRGSAAGAIRLVLLALAATGFLAMHGIAATDPVAGHVSPLDDHSVIAPAGTSMAMHDAGPAPEMGAGSSTGSHDHDDIAACAFVLLTILTGVVLYALGWGSRSTGPIRATFARSRHGRPRAPPRPIFLSLCVFRV